MSEVETDKDVETDIKDTSDSRKNKKRKRQSTNKEQKKAPLTRDELENWQLDCQVLVDQMEDAQLDGVLQKTTLKQLRVFVQETRSALRQEKLPICHITEQHRATFDRAKTWMKPVQKAKLDTMRLTLNEWFEQFRYGVFRGKEQISELKTKH